MTKPGPGKFEGNESLEVAEALYETTLDGGCDETIGSVDELGWYGLILRNPPGWSAEELIAANPANAAVLATMEPNPAFENESTVGYIVSEDSNGFFTYQAFEDETALRHEWSGIVNDYLNETEDSMPDASEMKEFGRITG